jgi:peptide/nickel transport system permease protein
MVKENLQGLLYGSPAALTPAFCIASVTIAANMLVDWYLQQTSGDISGEILQ